MELLCTFQKMHEMIQHWDISMQFSKDLSCFCNSPRIIATNMAAEMFVSDEHGSRSNKRQVY